MVKSINNTEKILDLLIERISTITEVQSIGMSGSRNPLPEPGQGDIDIFIYCQSIPELEEREAIIKELGELLKDCRFNLFEGGRWGTGDFVSIKGIETWLMYFTTEEALKDVDEILQGKKPDKLDNYYYPIGRCAMLNNITVLFDREDFLNSLKVKLKEYPEELSVKLIQYHMEELEDIEDLERAVSRKDLLFYHFAIDIAMDHFLQALFALNKTYFPSRKRSLQFIQGFAIKPQGCIENILDVIRLGGSSEGLEESNRIWREMVGEISKLIKFSKI